MALGAGGSPSAPTIEPHLGAAFHLQLSSDTDICGRKTSRTRDFYSSVVSHTGQHKQKFGLWKTDKRRQNQ